MPQTDVPQTDVPRNDSADNAVADAYANDAVHRADPALRRQLLIVLAVSVPVAALALWGLQQWLEHLARTVGAQDPEHLALWLRRLMGGACFLVAGSLGAGAFWLQGLAADVESERRWPPRELRSSQDIAVLRGDAAAAMVRQLRIAATGLGLLATAIGLWALWLGWPRLR